MTPKQTLAAANFLESILDFLMSPIIRPIWTKYVKELLDYLYEQITGEPMPHQPGIPKTDKPKSNDASPS